MKAPKLYLRDCGIAHRFLNITDFESLLGHPIVGASWEAFVLENILSQLTGKWQCSYYRTSARAEIDIVLEGPKNELWAIEIKRSLAPTLSKGFHYSCDDIGATHKFVIYPGQESYPMGNNIEVVGLSEFLSSVNFN